MTSSKSRREPSSKGGRSQNRGKSDPDSRGHTNKSRSGTPKHSSKHTHRQEHTSTHHHHHHKSSRSGRDTGTGTGTGTGKSSGKGSRAPKTDVESGRHPSSSLGPGLGDFVLIILLVILGISAIVLFVVGVWLLATRNGWPAGLNLTGNANWTRTLSYGTACVILSLLFIVIIVLAVLSAQAKRGGPARVTRLIIVFLASLGVLILVMMVFTGIFFAANGPRFIERIIRSGWINTVTENKDVPDACRIQDRYQCQGWELNSCRGCQPTVDGLFGNCSNAQRELCPRCFISVGRMEMRDTMVSVERKVVKEMVIDPVVRSDVQGCRRFVLRRYREFFIPFTVYAVFLAFLLIILSFKTCFDSTWR